jgi:hypothetical protein
VNQQAANAEFLIDPPTSEQSQPWRDRVKGWSRQQVDDRINAVWLDMASDAASEPEKRTQLRAEAQALSERIVAGAPQEVRDYIATPMTQDRIDALTRDELQLALAANAQAQQWAVPYAAMQTRVQAEFAALQAAAVRLTTQPKSP